MVIRSDKIGQSWLLPLDVSDLIPEDHICNLVEVVVDSMDVGEAEQKYRSGPGNSAYSRRMLLRLAIMASLDAIWSSRKIAKPALELTNTFLPMELLFSKLRQPHTWFKYKITKPTCNH